MMRQGPDMGRYVRVVPPRADTVLHAGDMLIVVGPVGALNDLAGRAR